MIRVCLDVHSAVWWADHLGADRCAHNILTSTVCSLKPRTLGERLVIKAVGIKFPDLCEKIIELSLAARD